MELVTLRLRASMTSPKISCLEAKLKEFRYDRREAPGLVLRQVRRDGYLRSRATRHWSERLKGPAIITEYSATTVIPSGNSFFLDRTGNLVIAIHKKQKAPG